MGAQNNDVNRTVDGDFAEGHIRVRLDEAEELKTRLDEAEGHAKLKLDDAEELKTRLDDAAEGHAVLRAPERPSTDIRQVGRRAKATISDADEAEGHRRI